MLFLHKYLTFRKKVSIFVAEKKQIKNEKDFIRRRCRSMCGFGRGAGCAERHIVLEEKRFVIVDVRANLVHELGGRREYKASSLWAYAAELNFKSQFYKGYGKYPVEDETKYISKFMAPGYLISSVGVNYTHPREDFKVLLSPMSEKMTFVTDRRLSDEGTYGVDQGKKVFAEFGALAKATYSKKFTENVLFGTELLLTSAYRTFGNVDMDWRLSLDWKLNKYFTFKANTYLLYDDDIKFVDKDGTRKGPRVQFKEVIGLGFGYIF